MIIFKTVFIYYWTWSYFDFDLKLILILNAKLKLVEILKISYTLIMKILKKSQITFKPITNKNLRLNYWINLILVNGFSFSSWGIWFQINTN